MLGWVLSTAALAPTIEAGSLTLDVHISRTANVFHIVDQLSGWSEFSHAQYRRQWGPLSQADEAQLERHRQIRAKRGWGAGLEQTFYVDDTIAEAANRGVKAGRITRAEAATEVEILEHFAKPIGALLKSERKRLEGFVAHLASHERLLLRFGEAAGALTRTKGRRFSVHLIANHADYDAGGGFNGDVLTLEVPRKADLIPTVLHELMHGYLAPHRPLLRRAAGSIEGLDAETLNEGIAYATSEMFLTSGTLAGRVARDIADQRAMIDAKVRFRRYGLALQPVLADAIEKRQTIEEFLPRALEARRLANAGIAGAGTSTDRWLPKRRTRVARPTQTSAQRHRRGLRRDLRARLRR